MFSGSDHRQAPQDTVGEVVENHQVMTRAYLMWIESDFIASTVRPGQFVMLGCGENTLLRRPLAVFATDEGRSRFAVLYGVVGQGTMWLSHRKVGEMLSFTGPLGNGFMIEPASRRLVLVAGGLGVAPLAFLAKVALDAGLTVEFLLGASSVDRVCPGQILPQGLICHIATMDGSFGRQGPVTGLVCEAVDEADQVFACGPQNMYVQLANMDCLRTLPVQVSVEVRMGCGIGGCYGCSIRTRHGMKRVCYDGPVFELRDVLWQISG